MARSLLRSAAVRGLFASLLGYFLTPGGLVLLAALDSSLIFFLPLGIDFAVIILSARSPESFWQYALLATLGSAVGAGVTFWIGRKVGHPGLKKLVKPSRLRRVEERVGHGAGIGVGALAAIPPPFPFTAFVLATGALRASPWSFFGTLAVVRLARFLVEGALASRYGRRILSWMDSTAFEIVVAVLIVLAIAGTAISAIALWRSTHEGRGGGSAVPSNAKAQ
jgi:membrane protein YqaA with SNARE-associated domain